MSDLKTVLTETLRQHGELEDSGGTCECGWYVRGSDHAEHVADVLLALSGVAVTQLPEPDPDNDPTLYDASFKVASDDEYMTGARTPRVCIDATTRELYTVCTPSAHISPAEARSYAAALLAAAGVFSEGATNA